MTRKLLVKWILYLHTTTFGLDFQFFVRYLLKIWFFSNEVIYLGQKMIAFVLLHSYN